MFTYDKIMKNKKSQIIIIILVILGVVVLYEQYHEANVYSNIGIENADNLDVIFGDKSSLNNEIKLVRLEDKYCVLQIKKMLFGQLFDTCTKDILPTNIQPSKIQFYRSGNKYVGFYVGKILFEEITDTRMQIGNNARYRAYINDSVKAEIRESKRNDQVLTEIIVKDKESTVRYLKQLEDE